MALKRPVLDPTKERFVDVVCKVTSQPYPVIQWWRNNIDVTSLSTGVLHSNESVNGLSVSTLRFNFTSVDDTLSKYKCVRKNQSSRSVECTASPFSCTAFYPEVKSETLVTRSAVVYVTLCKYKFLSFLFHRRTFIKYTQLLWHLLYHWPLYHLTSRLFTSHHVTSHDSYFCACYD